MHATESHSVHHDNISLIVAVPGIESDVAWEVAGTMPGTQLALHKG